MPDYRSSILEKIRQLEFERDETPIWNVWKISVINSKIERLGRLFKNNLKNG